MHHLSLATNSWKFRSIGEEATPWLPAVVPGCVHTDLLRLGKIPDPFWGTHELDLQWIGDRTWEYRTTFTAGKALLAESVIELVADGLDTVATVLLNGVVIAKTENMFVGFRWNIKPLLLKGRNELVVRFGSAMEYIRTHRTDHKPVEINDPVGGCTSIRKQQCQFGWDWGPRFITAGIWKDLRIEGRSAARLESVLVEQEHRSDGSVLLTLKPKLDGPKAGVSYCWELFFPGEEPRAGTGLSIEISDPRLWWPNGLGEQALYELSVSAVVAEEVVDTWSRRIGLRTLVLDQSADKWGQAFQFVVNGRPVFAKGANWIPANAFTAGLTRKDYERDLRSAAEAHMNMIRVWGGGIYEHEEFYDLCDELGLLVWQDFMFACTLYPADKAFVKTVREEAEHQVARLRHRACLALWCGNNEVYSINLSRLKADPKLLAAYNTLFHDVLPSVVKNSDPRTPYWPSSPWRGEVDEGHTSGEKLGDTHFWDVWHAGHPVKDYEKWNFRFVSEFGMQSYSSPETQATFCPDDDGNVFGATMENHQKNRSGNQIILNYVSRRYRFPKSQDDLIYLSQLNQAYCMELGVEFYRRSAPRCMGALYWQINDCWPVASWSSIEFTGRWKALHYSARRFFAPALITAHDHADDTPIIGNYRKGDGGHIDLYTVFDGPVDTEGLVRWDLFTTDGAIIQHGSKPVALKYGESRAQVRLDLESEIKREGRDRLFLRIALDVDGNCVSEDTVFLSAPRFVELPRTTTHVKIRTISERQALVTFESDGFQHRFAFEIPGLPHRASDNYFELYPREKRDVLITFEKPVTAAELKQILRYRSLADTYEHKTLH